MIDWSALQEMDATLQKAEKQMRSVLAEAYEYGLPQFSAKNGSGKRRPQAMAIVNRLSDSGEIRNARFLLESALAEKASPSLVAECLVRQLFPRAKYHIDLPREAFLTDVFALLEEAEPASCLAVFRAMLSLGRTVRFVPPAGHIADKVVAEDTRLHGQMRGFIRFEQLEKGFS